MTFYRFTSSDPTNTEFNGLRVAPYDTNAIAPHARRVVTSFGRLLHVTDNELTAEVVTHPVTSASDMILLACAAGYYVSRRDVQEYLHQRLHLQSRITVEIHAVPPHSDFVRLQEIAAAAGLWVGSTDLHTYLILPQEG